MKTIAVINQKGGVAKTTTAAAIGAALHKRGYKVLLIDLDAQANLTACTGAKLGGAFEMLNGERVKPQHTAQGDIIGSSLQLAAADLKLTETGKEFKLKEALENYGGEYDYCILDTPPQLNILTINGLTAADSAIIPAKADAFSLQGITQLSQTIDAIKKYCNSSLQITGIVLTMYNRRTILSREIVDVLQQTAQKLNTRLFDTKIRPCNALAEAQVKKCNIFDYAPRSNAAEDYTALTDEILRTEI